MRNNDEFKKLVTEKYNKQKQESASRKKKITAAISSMMVFVIIASVFIGNGAIERFFKTKENVEDLLTSGVPAVDSNDDITSDDITSNYDSIADGDESHFQSQSPDNDYPVFEQPDQSVEPAPEESKPQDSPSRPNVNPDRPPVVTETVNLMDGIKPHYTSSGNNKFNDKETLSGVTDFAFNLFKNTYSSGDNNVVSPASAIYALGMLANGADGYTLQQLKEKLCGTDLDRLNEFIAEYRTVFGNGDYYKTSISNSIWFDNNVSISDSFLQTNANYYGSDAFQTVLPSEGALDDINNWAKESTNGLIDKILEKFEDEPKVIIANSLYFEAHWYDEMTLIGERDFKTADGATKKVEMMAGNADYIENDFCYGFEKDYFGRYSFVALLPKNGISVNDVLNNLDSESYNALWDTYYNADITMPKFEIEADIDLEESLRKCGIDDIFAGGINDFSNIGNVNGVDFYVSKITQKAKIAVDEEGTLAAAVTIIQMPSDGMMPPETKNVDLDRPFVYMIIDRHTNIPMFMGTVESF